jgi:DNA-directed RNA polymerase subunit RPC12/RpoP
MKECIKCKKKYPLDMFHKNSQSPDGRKHECKNCKSKMNKKLPIDEIVAFDFYE